MDMKSPTLIIIRDDLTRFFELVGNGYKERCYFQKYVNKLCIPKTPSSLSWSAAETRVRKGRATYTIFFLSRPFVDCLKDYGFDAADYFVAML